VNLNVTDEKVLVALLRMKPDTPSFRGLQKQTRISPRILRRHLDVLATRQLITEKGKRLKHGGSPLSYRLDSKGQKVLAEHIKEHSEDIVLLNPKLFKGLLAFYMERNRQLENRKFTAYPVRKE